jgi:hypothetical protein
MVILEADNRILTSGAKYSYTLTNYSSGVSAFSVLNATDSAFAVDKFLLLGNFGAEDAEIVKISSVNNNTGAIVTTTATLFAHSESTRVTVLAYDQIRFFHTTTTTFDNSTPLSSFIALQPSDWFTTWSDEVYSSGYGWFAFYNTVDTIYSQESNAIPYAGFESDTTQNILADFFSLLNNKELKLVTREDALSWASEAYGRMRNKLNLTNVEYTGSAVTALSVLADTIEYDLPTDFDHLLFFVSGLDASDVGAAGGNKVDIEFMPLRKAYSYNGTNRIYYIRGSKLGILPTPSVAETLHYMYQKRAARLSINTDEVDLPNGGEYVIKDYMLYRAYTKFQNQSMAKQCLEAFTNGLNDMVIASCKRDAHLDTWDVGRSNV